MTLITIKDLSQSDDLDREAMRSIVGGAAAGARPVQIDQLEAGNGRIVEYPPGFGRRGPLPARSSALHGTSSRNDRPCSPIPEQ